MKTLSKLTLAAGVAAIFSVVTNMSADGVAASPKVQQMLNERAARSVVAVSAASITYRTPGPMGMTASPKISQLLAERKMVVNLAPAAEVVSSGYNPTSPDGVAASPKLRSQLNERNAPIVIAPLK